MAGWTIFESGCQIKHIRSDVRLDRRERQIVRSGHATFAPDRRKWRLLSHRCPRQRRPQDFLGTSKTIRCLPMRRREKSLRFVKRLMKAVKTGHRSSAAAALLHSPSALSKIIARNLRAKVCSPPARTILSRLSSLTRIPAYFSHLVAVVSEKA